MSRRFGGQAELCTYVLQTNCHETESETLNFHVYTAIVGVILKEDGVYEGKYSQLEQ